MAFKSLSVAGMKSIKMATGFPELVDTLPSGVTLSCGMPMCSMRSTPDCEAFFLVL